MRFCTFNVENLFFEQENSSLNKSPAKAQWLAKVINDVDAEVTLLTEVGGQKSLNHFISNYLDDHYIGSLIPGNSQRSIDLAYLIKKDSKLSFEHFTHRNRELNFLYPSEKSENERLRSQGKKEKYSSHFMSRDIAELRVYSDKEKSNLLFIVLGVHLKSKLDDTGEDWNGIKRRESELKLLLTTYRILNKRFNQKVPIFLTGDFNGDAALHKHEIEFSQIYENDHELVDIGDLLNWEKEQKTTFVLFDKEKKPQYLQLDYFFINKKFSGLIDGPGSCVYRYHQEDRVLPLPQSPFARAALPSDHYPLVISLRL